MKVIQSLIVVLSARYFFITCKVMESVVWFVKQLSLRASQVPLQEPSTGNGQKLPSTSKADLLQLALTVLEDLKVLCDELRNDLTTGNPERKNEVPFIVSLDKSLISLKGLIQILIVIIEGASIYVDMHPLPDPSVNPLWVRHDRAINMNPIVSEFYKADPDAPPIGDPEEELSMVALDAAEALLRGDRSEFDSLVRDSGIDVTLSDLAKAQFLAKLLTTGPVSTDD